MSGVPQKHRGIINTQAKPSYVMLELVILSQEGKRAALRNLESSPALQDEYTSAKGVTSVDMLEAVENNGNGYDFTLENTNSPKTDYAVYSYVDDMRTKRMIPRWAIS